jgi:hypothetical protein
VRLIFAGICVVLGTIPTQIFYASTQNDKSFDPKFYAQLLVAGFISFGVFSILHFKIESRILSAVLGCFGSYAALIAVVFMVSFVLGEVDETMMWFPVMLLFGIPFFASVIAMAYLASLIAFAGRRATLSL